MRLAVLAFAAGVLSLPLAAHADLVGDTVNVVYAYPDQGTVFANLGNVVVPGSGAVNGGLGSFQITGSQIIITSGQDQTFAVSDFNGFEFTVTSTDPMITGVTLDNASTLFGNPVTFTSDSVDINLSGLG